MELRGLLSKLILDCNINKKCYILISLFKGMLSARGSALLFADADGATKFNDLKKLDESLISILGCKLKKN